MTEPAVGSLLSTRSMSKKTSGMVACDVRFWRIVIWRRTDSEQELLMRKVRRAVCAQAYNLVSCRGERADGHSFHPDLRLP
jgi:hypothetical protein